MKQGSRVEVKYDGPGGWDWRLATVRGVLPDGMIHVTFDDPPTGHPSWVASPENVRLHEMVPSPEDDLARALGATPTVPQARPQGAGPPQADGGAPQGGNAPVAAPGEGYAAELWGCRCGLAVPVGQPCPDCGATLEPEPTPAHVMCSFCGRLPGDGLAGIVTSAGCGVCTDCVVGIIDKLAETLGCDVTQVHAQLCETHVRNLNAQLGEMVDVITITGPRKDEP